MTTTSPTAGGSPPPTGSPSGGAPSTEVTFIGVRHHSPACARLVADTIAGLRPAYVLVEGPADMNDRLDELLLGHRLPIAVYTSYRDPSRRHGSWAPLCEYSPEWAALTAGRSVGAELRFIDLPAWHPAFAAVRNRYADAEARYAEVIERLCRAFSVDDVDALWDHLFEIEPADGLAERLITYFDLVRGDAEPGPDDTAREAYMARWIRAAAADAGGRPVVVVTGGFHRPALVRLAAQGDHTWPELPEPPDDAVVGSYLVPYSFRRLDAFDGYQSGMPSPGYYQQLWDSGPQEAARKLTEAVAVRLRSRNQPVSTADLIAARATADGLARVRGHQHPARVDVLDGLASALVNEALEVPLPWSSRGRLRAGNHPAIVEMVAALSGDRVGRLHSSTPLPPLVNAVAEELRRHGLDGSGQVRLDLGKARDRERSRLLHRLRVLAIPGTTREAGPRLAGPPVLMEEWTLAEVDERLPALIEAGGYGVDPLEAAAAVLTDRLTGLRQPPPAPTDVPHAGAVAQPPGAGTQPPGTVTQPPGAVTQPPGAVAQSLGAGADLDRLADLLFDAALCGIGELAGQALDDLARSVDAASDLGALGRTLAVVLAMWRHGDLFGTSRSTTLGTVITAATGRALWLAEGVRGGAAPADLKRIAALAAVRDALAHAATALSLDTEAALGVADRVAACHEAPPDLRGAAYGLSWSLRALAPGGPSTAVADPVGETGDDVPGPPTVAVDAAGASGDAVLGPPPPAFGLVPARAIRGAFTPETAGDWLAGLFALAREEVLHTAGMLELLDELVAAMTGGDFLVALPALRQAFAFFPPRERHLIATRLVQLRSGSSHDLLRLDVAPALVASGMALDERVEAALRREGLIT